MAFKKGVSGNVKGRPKGSTNRGNIYKELYHDLIGTFKTGSCYVYYHILEGDVIYIGKGRGERAWSFSCRKYEDIKSQVSVKIVCCDLSEEEALAIEKELIISHQPLHNTKHTITI